MQYLQYTVGPVGTNCYVAFNDTTKECFIVDPGDDVDLLIDRITQYALLPKAILLTHGHFDHAGGAAELAANFDIPVMAYEGEKETLESPSINLSGAMFGNPAVYKADKYLRDNEVINIAGVDIKVLFTPGHTAGGCCFYLESEAVLFSGDTLFCGSVGRSDFPGGSASTLVRSIRERLLDLPGHTKVLPGHDSHTTIGQERQYNPFL